MTWRLDWFRAAVLAANHVVASVAGIVLGVTGATSNWGAIFTAGLAGLVAGTESMALRAHILVSSQPDSELVLMQKRQELVANPEQQLAELTALYAGKGCPPVHRPAGRHRPQRT